MWKTLHNWSLPVLLLVVSSIALLVLLSLGFDIAYIIVAWVVINIIGFGLWKIESNF